VVWAGRPPVEHAGIEQRERRPDRVRVVAVITGLLSVVLAVAVPFLPVRMEVASLAWPQAGVANSVAAPLVSYAPVQLSARVPCSALAAVADTGGVVVSTVPRQSADMERYGFVVKVVPGTADRPGRVDVVSRSTLLWSGPLESVRARDCALAIEVSASQAAVSVLGGGDPSNVIGSDVRPQVVGVFTDLAGAAPEGMRVDIDIDSRFSTSPTPLKLAAIVVCLLLTLAALVMLPCGPSRWPVHATVSATTVVAASPDRRGGVRDLVGVAFHRREHFR
jgi:arabinosyltransferase C